MTAQKRDIAQSGPRAPIYLRYLQDCALYGTLRTSRVIKEKRLVLFSIAAINTPVFEEPVFSVNVD